MTDQLQVALVVAVLVLALGIGFVVAARWQLSRWIQYDAEIISAQSKDSDWDLLEVRYIVSGQEVTATVGAPSELGHSRQRCDAISIRYNPRAPQVARLASSRGKVHIVGVFFIMVGIIWLGCILAMRA